LAYIRYNQFTNFALLYVNPTSLPKQLTGTVKVWALVLSIAVLIALKYFVKWVIRDSPPWVEKELEKLRFA